MPVSARLPDASVKRPIFYLHGFASSAQSTKAGFLADRLHTHGLTLRVPDFNLPEFSSLTMTRMLDQLAKEISAVVPEPVVLIGSSLGGTLAILAAERLGAQVDRLVLLAPAVMFAKPGHHLLPPKRLEEWRSNGELPFFHYGYGEKRPLRFSFYEDTVRYDAFDSSFRQPTLIFQGLRDASVDHGTVERFAGQRPNVTFVPFQLTASLPRIWAGMEPFLGLT